MSSADGDKIKKVTLLTVSEIVNWFSLYGKLFGDFSNYVKYNYYVIQLLHDPNHYYMI